MLTNQRMEEFNTELFLHVDLVALGLNANSWYALILGNNVDPVAIAFFGHGSPLPNR